MKLMYRILLVNIGLCLIIALINSVSTGIQNKTEFFFYLGIACLGASLIDLLISIILFFTGEKNREWAQGFIFSCGALLLIGFTVCTTSLNGMKLH